MGKLKAVTELFNKLNTEGDKTVYTEQMITNILKKANILQYDCVQDIPNTIVQDILSKLGIENASASEETDELLDFFQEIVVNGKTELQIIAKSLRYLKRNNKRPKTAIIVIDVQNDFISGSLALRNTPAGQEGSEVVPVINNILDMYHFDAVFYSLDWHPEDHCSYCTNVSKYMLHESSAVTAEDAKVFDKVVYNEGKVLEQVLWPVHCLQGSEGAQLHSELNVLEKGIKIYKGTLPNVDSYSALWDNGKLSRSEMLGHLFDLDITCIFTCGLATDFCVGMTSLDAVDHGFDVCVVLDACRGVADDTMAEMKERMRDAGCEFINSSDIYKKMSAFASNGDEDRRLMSQSKSCNLL